MGVGIMEVLLLSAKGLSDCDFIGDMDPYVVIQYRNQERKSSIARGDGSNPEWNEKFSFRVEYPGADNRYKIILKIMDKDTFTVDDFVGQATIYVEDLLLMGVEKGSAELHPVKYSVVGPDQAYCGEIKVGVTFTHQTVSAKPEEDENDVKSSCIGRYTCYNGRDKGSQSQEGRDRA